MQESALAEIRSALRGLLPPGVTFSSGATTGYSPPLLAAELPATARMSARRLAEFAAGRAHARRALEELGLVSPAVPVGADRAPRWPDGFVGSITHGGQLAIAVAAPATTLRGIGIDTELSTSLDDELMRRVCRPEELAQLDRAPLAGQRAKLIFSAKESVYKCLAPLTGVFLEFEDLELRFDAEPGTFVTRGHGPAAALIRPGSVRGSFAAAGGYWITAAWQSPADASGPG